MIPDNHFKYQISNIKYQIFTFKVKYSIFISFLFFTNWCLADDIPVTIKTEVDTTIATIGDRIQLTINLLYPEGTVFEFPQIKKRLGEFEVVDEYFSKPERYKNGYKQNWNLVLTIFDTGRIAIPSLEIKARSAYDSTAVLSFKTDSPIINVISVLPPNTVEPKDIKPPFPLRTVIPWDIIVFVLLIISIVVVGILYYRRWEKIHPQIAFDESFLEPPHVIAFNKLNRLKEESFSTTDEQRRYYFSLSEILREYLERRYFIRTLEMSTFEIVEAFRGININGEIAEKFAQVFGELDLVKFAKRTPAISEIPIVWEKVYSCIDKTKREPLLNRRLM